MRAGVEHDDGALGNVLDVLHGAGKVKAASIGIVVPRVVMTGVYIVNRPSESLSRYIYI